jgi:hypothetical protein
MPASQHRLILRAGVKLLTLTALLATTYILFSGGDKGTTATPAIAPLLVELKTLQPAQPQRLAWAGGTLQLLRMNVNTPPYLFRDQGGSLNCPLSWHPPGAPSAPIHPWPGGFRDQCSNVWYRYDGQVLPGQANSRGLQTVPYQLQDGDLLVTGGNRDNAATAN